MEYLSPAGDFQADGARTGTYILGGEELTLNSKGESVISYADYAIAMVDEVVSYTHLQIVCFADCRSFLADGKVRRAGIGVVDARIHALLLDIQQHQLEGADGEHILVDAHEIFFAEVCFLIFDGLVILVDVDILEMNLSRSPKLVRVSNTTKKLADMVTPEMRKAGKLLVSESGVADTDIDNLLSALNSGEFDPDEAGETDDRQIKDYDFARPSKFSKEHRPAQRSNLHTINTWNFRNTSG